MKLSKEFKPKEQDIQIGEIPHLQIEMDKEKTNIRLQKRILCGLLATVVTGGIIGGSSIHANAIFETQTQMYMEQGPKSATYTINVLFPVRDRDVYKTGLEAKGFKECGVVQERGVRCSYFRGDRGTVCKKFGVSAEYAEGKYFSRLCETVTRSNFAKKSTMEQVADIAYSQVGYCQQVSYHNKTNTNWSGTGTDIRDSGSEGAGNTEYTRWLYEEAWKEKSDMAYSDINWCAVFASWCIGHSDYEKRENVTPDGKQKWSKEVIYSYGADGRYSITKDKETMRSTFRLGGREYYSEAITNNKLKNYTEETRYVPTNRNQLNINFLNWTSKRGQNGSRYAQGSLILFDWAGDGRWFDHVGIVESCYRVKDKNGVQKTMLSYIAGNEGGHVVYHTIYLEDTGWKEVEGKQIGGGTVNRNIPNYKHIAGIIEY